jgi:hypothetical protein
MSCVDAMSWLDDHGGRWFVSATAAGCVVVATLGTTRVTAAADRLDVVSVHGALVDAVAELCSLAPAA